MARSRYYIHRRCSLKLEEAILAGIAWEDGHSQQIAYASAMNENGHIYEFIQHQNQPWRVEDIMKKCTDAAPADGFALIGYAWETGFAKQVVYVGSNHHIYELQMPLDGTWEQTDLTQHLGVPEASEDVIAAHEWTPEFAKHIVYLDITDHPHMHSLMLKHGGKWHHTDLTSSTGSPLIALLRAGK